MSDSEQGRPQANGRLYDLAIARFLSPDNYVQLPDNAQNFNRYSYCLNNPLDISALHSGYYLVFATLNGKQYCKKIVRQ